LPHSSYACLFPIVMHFIGTYIGFQRHLQTKLCASKMQYNAETSVEDESAPLKNFLNYDQNP